MPADGLHTTVLLDGERLQLALEHEMERRHQHALLGHRLPRLDLAQLGGLGPALELIVVEALEQVDPAQLLDARVAHALARYSCMSETAIEPSPTALATRLIERARTSPATNTPGTLVSST